MKSILQIIYLLLVSSAAQADLYHYNNLLVGERAMGLGGAFTAVSDDASGIVYNPAGIAFAISNDISGSANAFYTRKLTYKETIGQEDFIEESSGNTAPFFGSLVKLDHIIDGLAMAFGIYNLDSELKNQNDLIENTSLYLQRFHRTSNIRAGTMGGGVAVAMRAFSGMSFGFGINILNVDELVQEYQHVTYTDGRFLAQNIRTHLQVYAAEYSLGTQFALGQLSVGLNLKYRTVADESYDASVDQTTNFDASTQALYPVPLQIFTSNTYKKPLGVMPAELRLGLAWFASARLLLAADAIHYTEAKDGYSQFDREAVTNFAMGAEYYITPSVPVRIGVFTNNDTRPEIDETKSAQADHIDFTGTSLFFAWVQPNSQVSFGSVYQVGTGKAQKTGDSNIQDVEAESITFAFSATHSL